MSESEDGGPGRREVAHRVFAAEFDDAEFSYSESDEERAPNYVVTPTGARVNRLFAVGVLTELEQVNEEVLRARIVDPTGAFVVYAGQYQPEALAFLEAATPPLFVAVTGKARTFEPEDGDRVFTSIRPESISEVDAETRDRWVVQAARQTADRVGRMAGAKQSELTGETLQDALVEAGLGESDAAGITLALDYYDTTGDYLQAVRELALNAARVVAGERDEAGSLSLSPGDGGDEPLALLAALDLEAPTDDATGTDEPTTESQPETTPDTDLDTGAASTDVSASTGAPETGTDSTAGTAESADEAAETAEAVEPSATGDAEPSETEPSTATAAVETGGTEQQPPSDSGTSGDPDSATEPDPDATATGDPEAGDDGSETLGDFDSGGESTADEEDVSDFDPEFELDEDEREEIESEYGTDFQSGTEVDEAGEAGIETPDPEELAEAEAADAETPADATETTAAAETDPADASGADGGAPEPDASDDGAAGGEPAADVDLEDAVMDVMTELNDGGGADREAVRQTVVDEYGADPDDVDDAIQDALMGGRCYEPDDGKLTPI